MGQNLSSSGVSNDQLSPRNKTKPPRPTQPPQVPKIPNYVVPENKVIRDGPGDMEAARRLLRPVSQELSKVNPEFANLFHPDPEMEFLASGGEDSSLERSLDSRGSDKENHTASRSGGSNVSSNVPNPVSHMPDPNAIPNGKVPLNNRLSQSMDNVLGGPLKVTNLKRTHSLQRDKSNIPKKLGHKRQASLTNVAPVQQPSIPEDPREHLYNITRLEPFSNLMPATASLPVKSSFDADISLNLTYAQLAEYRRQQRNQDLDNAKEKRLKELGSEISATCTVPKSPFDRANLGAKFRTHSISTGSSENGVSKTKKKKAPPPPPGSPGAAMSEPPVDYDQDDDESRNHLQRRNSSASRSLRPPAPVPFNPAKRMSIPVLNTSSLQTSVPPPPPPPPPAPPLPPTQPSAQALSTSAANNSTVAPNSFGSAKPADTTGVQDDMARLQRMIDILKQRKNQPVENSKVENNSEDVKVFAPTDDSILNSDEKENNNSENLNTESLDIPLSDENLPGENKEAPKLKRMNSLLKHDIILAAQAQAARHKKTKQPQLRERPKDAEQVMREEIQKAAQAMENRRKEAIDNNGEFPAIFKSEEKTGSNNADLSGEAEPADFQSSEQAEPSLSDHVDGATQDLPVEDQNRSSSIPAEEMSISSNNSQRVYSSAWTPEDDLEPDDDIMEEKSEPERPQEVDGFKMAMIPTRIENWKDGEGDAVKIPVTKDKDKFGSIRRFKNNVRESMRNVFGGKSKSSGKDGKQRKSRHDLNQSDSNAKAAMYLHRPSVDGAENWELTRKKEFPMRRSRSEDLLQHAHMNGNGIDSHSDESDNDVDDIDFASGLDGKLEDDHEQTVGKESNATRVRQMKRAGVAYYSGTGQILVLPEYNTVTVDEEGNEVGGEKTDTNRAPRLFNKKDKKLTYESTMRVQERSRREDMIAKEIKEKETQIERERQRQQEIERGFRRLRDLDTQERLQRMQTNSMLEQISLLQRQQVSQAHAQLMSPPAIQSNVPFMNGGPALPIHPAPILPINNGQPQNFAHLQGPFPNQTAFSNTPTFTNIFLNQTDTRRPTMSPSINASQYTAHSAPMIGNAPLTAGGLPNLSTQELSNLSDYMRMMGVTPPSTQQQWATLLSSISFNGPGMPGLGGDLPVGRPTPGTGGPDLSTLFGVNKTLESTVASSRPAFNGLPHNGSAGLPMNAPSHGASGEWSEIPHGLQNGTTTSRLVELQPEDVNNSAQNTQSNSEQTDDKNHTNKTSADSDSKDENKSRVTNASSLDTNKSEKMNGISWNATNGHSVTNSSVTPIETSAASEDKNSSDGNTTSPEQRIDLLTSKLQSTDANSNQNNSSTVQDQNGAHISHSPMPPRFPSKVYGPIGFRPVTFRAGAT